MTNLSLPSHTHPATGSTPHSATYLWLVCLGVGMSGLMFGLDSAVISGGIDLIKAQFGLNPEQEGWIVSSAMAGCIAGVASGGWFADRYGRKPALVLAGFLFLLSLLGSMLAPNSAVLAGMRLLGGLGIGISSVVSPAFISEAAPARSRGRMVSLYQLAITVGILLAFCSNALITGLSTGQGMISEAGYWHQILVAEKWRGMFGACVLPAVINIFCALLLPESPRWLLKQGQEARARRVLERLAGPAAAENQIAEVRRSLMETQEDVSLASVFRSRSLRRPLFIGCFLSTVGALCGINAIMYYAPTIFESAGLGTNGAHVATVIIGIFNIGFTVVALLTVDRLGRRPLMLVGVAGVLVALVVAGGMFFFKLENPWWLLVPLLGHVAFFAFSYGTCGWIITSEIFPTRVRGRAASLCMFFGWSSGFLLAQTFPRLLSSFGGGGTFWIYAGITLVALIFVWRAVPETKGKSLEEIESYWLKHH